MSAPTLLGGQTQIDIRAIERELTELWKTAAGDDELGGAVTRACTLNLIAVSYGASAEQSVTIAVDRLTGTHPHRALVVHIEEPQTTQTPPIEAWVQAHCQIPAPGRPQVCCEQITIVTHGEGVLRVPGIILPLLVADVPIVVWYPEGEPFGDALFARLAELADRVVIDTEHFVDPEGGLRRLVAMRSEQMVVGDLAWGRLTLWRELIAQCFDSAVLLGQITQLERVRITYGARCSRVPGLLLTAWLVARLGWRIIGKSGPTEATLLRFQRPDGGEVMVELRRITTSEEQATHLVAVEIIAPDQRISIEAGAHSGMLMTKIESDQRPALLRSASWHRPDTAELLATELRLLRRDRAYESVLQLAVSFI
jgi:glucose-6-phosphate dehydrogenase assembly protein OpcA